MFTVFTSSASVIVPKSTFNRGNGEPTGAEVVLHGLEPERDDVDVALEAIDPNEQTADVEGRDHD